MQTSRYKKHSKLARSVDRVIECKDLDGYTHYGMVRGMMPGDISISYHKIPSSKNYSSTHPFSRPPPHVSSPKYI